MKYWIRIILALSLFVAVPVLAKTVYLRTSLTGGGADALDQVDGDDLLGKDTAIVTYSGEFYFYELDATSGATENPPGIISPDLNAGNKRWILQGLHALGAHVQQNLITNSSFGAWSDGTVADYSDGNSGFSALHPTSTCTDPDNDQNNTNGWTALFATLTSEAGGVTGNRLKVAATANTGFARTDHISLTSGKVYRLKTKAGADIGDDYKVYVYSSTYVGHAYNMSYKAGAGAGNWDTIDEVFECPSTQTDWIVYLQMQTNGDNGYFDNVSLSEITPACVAADTKAHDNHSKTSTLDIYRWQDDSTHCKGLYGLKSVKGVNATEYTYLNSNTYNKSAWYSRFSGRTMTLGCWIYSVSASDNIKLAIYDGVDSSSSSFIGADSLTWAKITHDVSANNTQLGLWIQNDGDTGDVAYISQPKLSFGDSIGEGNYIQPPGETIWLESSVTLTDYSGVTVSTDTSVNLEEQSSGKIPKGVKAVYAQITAQCANTDKYIALLSESGGSPGPRIEDILVANKNHTAVGWCPCDADGDIYIDRDDTFTNVTIKILGVEIR